MRFFKYIPKYIPKPNTSEVSATFTFKGVLLFK